MRRRCLSVILLLAILLTCIPVQAVEVMDVSKEEQYIYTQLIAAGITEDKIGYEPYEKAQLTLTLLSYPLIQDYPNLYGNLCMWLGLSINTPQHDNLVLVYDNIISRNYDDMQKLKLFDIAFGRTSIAGPGGNYTGQYDKSLNVIKYDQTEDANAAYSATTLYNQIKTILSQEPVDAVLADKQLDTIARRTQYHYYMMQSNTASGSQEDITDILELSKVTTGFGAKYELDPVDFKQINICDAMQYSYFMNCLHEIKDEGRYLMLSGLSNLSSTIKYTTDIVTNANYLMQLKAAMTFLEGLPEEGLQDIVDWWYDDTIWNNSKSLESLYLEVKDLDIEELDVITTTPSAVEKPFRNFFDLESNTLNSYLKIGIANTATFVPLQTNVYEPSSYTTIQNDDFFNKFHYIWGYNRKALYIDTSASAAVDTYTTGKCGSLKVATLQDLLNCDRDIVLYTDTELYNENQVQTLLEKVDEATAELEEKKEIADTYAQDGIAGLVCQSIGKWATDAWDAICDACTQFGDAIEEALHFGTVDSKFFSKDAINEFFNTRDYSPEKAWAVTSAVARDKDTKNYLAQYSQQPVFVSSKELVNVKNADNDSKASFFNYVMLKNIESNRLIDYKSTLDYTNPVFIDIYGNITTYSGTVVIPAAANQTFYKRPYLYTTAFLASYGSEYKIPKDYSEYIESYTDEENLFEWNADSRAYELKNIEFDSVVSIRKLSYADKTTKKRLYNLQRLYMEKDSWKTGQFASNVLVQVMLGAPIESIDVEAEGLNKLQEKGTAGIKAAYQLEELKSSLNSSKLNTIISVPNMAFMPYIEYVIYFLYRVSVVGAIIMILVQIYIAVYKYRASISLIVKLPLSIGLVIAVMFSVPFVFDKTYYTVNKALLQNESLYFAMLNYEKKQNGISVGVTELQDPDIHTKLYIKVKDVEVPWGDMFKELVTSSVSTAMRDVYSKYASNDLENMQEDFVLINHTIYMDVDDLFGSSDVVFNQSSQTLYQFTHGQLSASFYMPYYVFLDGLISSVNTYNVQNKAYSYSTLTYASGKMASVGLIDDYLLSDDFLKGVDGAYDDLLYLMQIYGFDIMGTYASPFSTEAIEQIQSSGWCDADLTTYNQDLVEERIVKMNEHLRQFVSHNRDMLGRVSDDTFLKAMALDAAIYYNQLFGNERMSTIEINNLSPDDIGRLSMATRELVMKDSAYTYPRFVYEAGGRPAVYVAGAREILTLIENWVKPIATFVVMMVFYIAVFIRKLILDRDTGGSVKGYLKMTLLIILINLLHAGALKLMLFIPKLGAGTTLCLFIQCIKSVIFIFSYVAITYTAAFNWRDCGNMVITNATVAIYGNVTHQDVMERVRKRAKYANEENPEDEGWLAYKAMKEADENRRKGHAKKEE